MLLISKNYVYHPVAKIAVAVVQYGLYVAYSSLHQANRVQINEDFFYFLNSKSGAISLYLNRLNLCRYSYVPCRRENLGVVKTFVFHNLSHPP